MREEDKKVGSAKNEYIAALVINLLVFCHGCAVGWVSPNLPLLSGPSTPLDQPLQPDQAALVASMICLAGIIFTPVYGYITDAYGRKTAAIISAIPYFFCWLLKLTWLTSTGMMVARFVGGIGAAGIFMLAPLYCSEVGSLETRGALSSLMIFSINLGVVFMYVIGAYVSYSTCIYMILPQPVIFVLLMWRMPETPSFLVKKKRFEEAAKAISWLRSLPLNSGIVRKQVEYLKYESELAKNTSAEYDLSDIASRPSSSVPEESSFKILLKSSASMKAFLVLLILLTAQTFMGAYAVVVYSTDIFLKAGSTLSPAASSIIVAVLQLVGSVIASSMIERVGRKVLMISSCAAVATCMAALAIFFRLQQQERDLTAVGWVPVVALSIGVFAFAMGAGPVPYALPPEIFIVQVRSLVTSIVLVLVWICSFIVAQLFGSAVEALGMDVVFWFFSIMGVTNILVTLFFLPETKGQTLDKVLEYYNGNKGSLLRICSHKKIDDLL